MPINNSTASDSVKAVRPHQVLDPALLGRPVHLLPAFAAAFAEDMAAMLSAPGWRRYWSSFELAQVVVERAPERDDAAVQCDERRSVTLAVLFEPDGDAVDLFV